MEVRPIAKWTWIAGACSLSLTWGSFFIVGPLNLILWISVLVLLLWRAPRLAKWFVAGSPYVLVPALGTVLGAMTYFTGTARLASVGLPGAEFYNLDPVYRVYRSSSGCIVTGSEAFWQLPNNLVVQGLVRVLGPMRGAHTGKYPTRDEATAAIEVGSVEVSVDDLAKGVSIPPAHNVRLSSATIEALRRSPRIGSTEGTYRAAVLDGVLVLKTVSALDALEQIVMVLPEKQEVIARYVAYRR